MKPSQVVAYLPPEERRRLRQTSFKLGLSMSRFVGLASMLVAAQAEADLAKGASPERVVARLTEQAGAVLAERR